MRGKKSFLSGSFRLTREHIELSLVAGYNQLELIEEYLVKLEIDFKLKPKSLCVYFMENKGIYKEYWYTEEENVTFILDFENKIFSFHRPIDPVLN